MSLRFQKFFRLAFPRGAFPRVLLFIFLILPFPQANARADDSLEVAQSIDGLYLLPLPQEMRRGKGTVCVPAGTLLEIEAERKRVPAGRLREIEAERKRVPADARTGIRLPLPQIEIPRNANLKIIENEEANATSGDVASSRAEKEFYILWLRDEMLAYVLTQRTVIRDRCWHQGYRISVEPNRIVVHYITDAGRHNARLTLRQLLRCYQGRTLPTLEIADWPAFAQRGWLDDISRGPVVNARFAAFQQRALAAFKFNFYSYYAEHTLAHPDFADVGPWAGEGVPAKSVPAVKPMANLQVFAHAEKTLRIPFYEFLRDGNANFNPANEATYDYLRERLLHAANEVYPDAEFFNINCDETEGLGSGRARELVQKIGADAAYIRHIQRVCEILKPTGKKVLMWGDIVAKNPAMIRELPADLQFIMWSYVAKPDFCEQIAPFARARRERGNEFWVASGIGHWSILLANPRTYLRNVAHLARDGAAADALGYICTVWDDNGESLFSNAWHGLAWAAEMAWHPLREREPAAAAAELAARERYFNEAFAALGGETSSSPIMASAATEGDEDASCPSDFSRERENWANEIQKLYYEVATLEDDPAVGDWFVTNSIYQPFYQFHPTSVDAAARERVRKVLEIAGTLLKKADALGGETSSSPSEASVACVGDEDVSPPKSIFAGTPFSFHAQLLAHCRYALHHLQASAHRAQLRQMVFDALNEDSTREEARLSILANQNLPKGKLKMARQECLASLRAATAKLVSELHKLKLEYLRLWDAESTEYSRHLICERFDALGRELLALDRHVFVEIQPNGNGCVLVKLRTIFGNAPIFYTLDGRQPTRASERYSEPFPLSQSCLLQTLAENEWGEGWTESRYLLCHKAMGCKIALGTQFSNYRAAYSGGGNGALCDGLLGSDNDYCDGRWQGYGGVDVDARIDLGSEQSVQTVTARFLQNTYDWILSPTQLRLYISTDGEHWQLAREQDFAVDWTRGGNVVNTLSLRQLNLRTRYLRLVAPNPGTLPDWHPARGNHSYLFADEIVVE